MFHYFLDKVTFNNRDQFPGNDIVNDLHIVLKPKVLWESRREYFEEFPLPVFRKKIQQEIRTAKYLHTLKTKGISYKAS